MSWYRPAILFSAEGGPVGCPLGTLAMLHAQPTARKSLRNIQAFAGRHQPGAGPPFTFLQPGQAVRRVAAPAGRHFTEWFTSTVEPGREQESTRRNGLLL